MSQAAFTTLALSPLGLLALGACLGGAVLWLGFLYMAALPLIMDRLAPYVAGNPEVATEFPLADPLLVVVGGGALVLTGLAVLAGAGRLGPTGGERVLIVMGAGFWLGQVGHPAAHELIHRTTRPLFHLGRAFYGLMLFGQHVAAHRFVHHIYVATELDPNTARVGESFYRFFPRAWWGSFHLGLAAARARQKGAWNSYHVTAAIGAGGGGLALLFAGPWGLLCLAALAFHVQIQILVSDYVQHYGLKRLRLPNGAFEPVGPRHSWNSGAWFSAGMTLNAPRHSDHHSHPARPYPALRLEPDAPRLPWPLPLACAIAFWPRRWHKRMRAPLAAVTLGLQP